MQTFSTAEVAEKFNQLPENAQEFISSVECTAAMTNIGKKYQLHIDQTGQLSRLITYTITGLVRFDDFKRYLTSDLGISDDEANLITYDLNQNIFIKVRNMLIEDAKKAKNEGRPDDSKADQNPTQDDKLAPANPSDIFAQKMAGTFSVPKEKVEVKAENSDNIVGTPTTDRKITDPYRESVIE